MNLFVKHVQVALHPVGEFLALTVPGLAEGRPSVLIGDKIILSSPSDPDGPRYEGYVHEVCFSAFRWMHILMACYIEIKSSYF